MIIEGCHFCEEVGTVAVWIGILPVGVTHSLTGFIAT